MPILPSIYTSSMCIEILFFKEERGVGGTGVDICLPVLKVNVQHSARLRIHMVFGAQFVPFCVTLVLSTSECFSDSSLRFSASQRRS